MSNSQRETLQVDVLIVGGGPAGLAAAIRLMQLASATSETPEVVIIEKGAEIGSHGISGAVVDPRALDELLPGWPQQAPVEAQVSSDQLWFMTERGRLKAPIIPPMLNNRGKYVASLQKLAKWMGERAEEAGAQVFPAFAGAELLWEGDRVAGVRTGDKGLDRDGKPKANYEPGADILAKIVILAEGPRGTLAKQAVARLSLDRDAEPQVYAAGIKEIWQCAPGTVQAGSVIHTLGYPLSSQTFGGGFIYGMANDVLDVGFVTGLDAKDPTSDPQNEFNRFKAHPAVRGMLEEAKLLRYGAKAIPEGGFFSMPRAYGDGFLIVGDSGGFLNGMRLKGIHLAVKSGMLAAEAAFEALQAGKYDWEQLRAYQAKFRDSWAYSEMRSARNFHQGFHGGLYAGMFNVGVGMVTGGRGFGISDKLPGEHGWRRMEKRGYRPKESPRAAVDGTITFDKLTDVYNSGTMHEEDQPCHLHVADTDICRDRCTVEYGNPCKYFCPAAVYEPLFERTNDHVEGRLQINFTNCVHCKTCDIIDPYQIITWVPPQGGEGPTYTGL